MSYMTRMRSAIAGVTACAISAFVVLSTTTARADLLARMLDADGAGSTAPSADDLLAWAGPSEETSLPAILSVAVRAAPSLQQARIDIAVAEAQITETWIRNDYTIKAQALASKTNGGVIDGFPINGSENLTVGADVLRSLSTGAVIDIHAGTQYSDLEAGGIASVFASATWVDTVTASITQPLLKGRGRVLFDAPERKAQLNRDATVLANRLAAINVVQTIVSSYWDLVLAERQVAITEQSLDLARERLRVTEVQADGGKTARSEIPAVQQIIATRQEDVLNGQLAVLNASIALRRASGMPIGKGALGLHVASDLQIADVAWDLGALVEQGYAASPQLVQLAKQADGATVDIDVTENGLMPQLDLALQAGPTGDAGGFNNAFKGLVEFNSFTVGGSLTFSRTLSQWDVRGRSRELRTARQKIAVSAVDLRAQIADTISFSVAQLELAKRRVVLSQRAIDLANENIRIETDRFNLGRSTNFDVLNRLEDLRQAELRKAQAMVDWHKAEVVVESLTGQLLPRFGIAVD
jgi:outer membrane protein